MNYKNVKISEDARIAKQSVVIGDVTIGRDSCVLHYAVIRGEDVYKRQENGYTDLKNRNNKQR